MNQDVFLMHFEGRLCQQNSRIPVFVRKLFVYFVIRKEIEHKNVKRQVLEPLPANGSLKKSQPIARQVRFDCLQNLEIWSLFQGLAATHTAICEWWVEFFIAVQFVKNLRQRFQPWLCFTQYKSYNSNRTYARSLFFGSTNFLYGRTEAFFEI